MSACTCTNNAVPEKEICFYPLAIFSVPPSLLLPPSFSLPPLSSTPQARLQRANTLLRLGKIDEAAGDFQVLSDTASGTVKEDAQVQVCIHVVFTGMPCSLFLIDLDED